MPATTEKRRGPMGAELTRTLVDYALSRLAPPGYYASLKRATPLAVDGISTFTIALDTPWNVRREDRSMGEVAG